MWKSFQAEKNNLGGLQFLGEESFRLKYIIIIIIIHYS